MHVGFSGSRHGPATAYQRDAFLRALIELRQESILPLTMLRFRHGDCLGWDALAHDIAKRLGWPITIHPPDKPMLRAFKNKGDPTVEVLPPRPYLHRNRDIVQASSIVIITPDSHEPRRHSGTWYTYEYARTVGKRTILLLPNGLRRA